MRHMKSRPDTPPSYLSCASLARELDLSETTVRQMTEKGLLPPPIRLGGSVRWRWIDVEEVLHGGTPIRVRASDDPYLAGAFHATQEN